jgi:hypothetical protein
MSEEKQPRKNSSIRHTRAVQKSRISQPITAPSDEQVRERIQEIVHPSTLSQVSYFYKLGVRQRTWSFVAMVAFVLEMIWRQNVIAGYWQSMAQLWMRSFARLDCSKICLKTHWLDA